MRDVVTVMPGREPELSKAVDLAMRMKSRGRIADWQSAPSLKCLTIILKLDTGDRLRTSIVREFESLGYDVTEE